MPDTKTDRRPRAGNGDQNARRAAAPLSPTLTVGTGRRPHCCRGHRLIGANLYVRPSRPSWRECVTCRRAFVWLHRRAWFGLPAKSFADAEKAVWAYFPELADDARGGAA